MYDACGSIAGGAMIRSKTNPKQNVVPTSLKQTSSTNSCVAIRRHLLYFIHCSAMNEQRMDLIGIGQRQARQKAARALDSKALKAAIEACDKVRRP